MTQLVFGELGESGDDSAAGGDGYEFDLGAADPSDCRQLILEEEVIRLVVETPLTDDQVGAGVLDLRKD